MCVLRGPRPSLRVSAAPDGPFIPRAGEAPSLREWNGLLVARRRVVVAEPLPQRLLELAGGLELLDDVGAADQLALHEHLWDRRPAGDRRKLLANQRIGKDVDRG